MALPEIILHEAIVIIIMDTEPISYLQQNVRDVP